MKRRMWVSGASGMLLLTPHAVSAQTIRATPRTSNTPGGNMCMQLATGPSRLAGSPEGQTLIRMRAELDAVERAVRSDTLQRKQIIIVKGRLDSVGRMLTGSGDPGANRIFFEARPGSPMSVDGQRGEGLDQMNQVMVIAKLRELQPQVAELSRGGASPVVGTVDITLPTLGYIGISASAGTFPTSIDPMQPFAYCEYPRVESVEAGSPADKAGLLAGDTLIAYNGRDLRQTNVNYPELLIPGNRLSIRYRREGRVLQTSVVVAAKDPDYMRTMTSISACSEAEAAAGCRSDRVQVRASVAGSNTRAAKVSGMMSPTNRAPLVSFDGSGGLRFAGALIRAIDEQTAQNMGADAGLLVIDLPASATSYQAGLRGGDLVLSANGVNVRDISSFLRAFESKVTEHLMTMQVTNKTAGAHAVTIRW